MARLNEVPMSTDSIETLRKKFLRQNRDIARVNSAQSLRIRSLESECGRLLSDNLTLNGRILELERDLEECREAQRIADHALEIKARMEAQLEEWSAMLGGLGVERAAKRHARSSPGGTTVARKRTSMDRSPAAKQRPRDSRSSADMAALHEGRLPPIQENTTYPRRTMNHNEILAICTEAENSKDSPDLGPPPTSRFVEEPVKVDSPSRSTGTSQPSPKLKIQALLPSSSPSRPDMEPTKQPSVTLEASPPRDDPRPIKAAHPSIHPSVKAGSKRKFGDENDESQVSRAFPTAEKSGSKHVIEKPLIVRDLKDRSGAKDLSSRPDEKKPETTDPTKKRPRQPLADKSRNDGMTSPKKLPKSATTGDLMKAMSDQTREVALKAAPLKKKRVVPIKLPSLPPPGPSAAKQPVEPETPSADPGLVFPDTPETKSTSEKPRDTPPPADISSHGETSRPSRRVRASVSYAEPNLRDKMRRPTKEMLDAVSGEGKYKRTSSVNHVTSVSALKPAADIQTTHSASTTQLPAAEAAMENEAARRPPVMSPLSQKDSMKEAPPAAQGGQVTTERRRRPSSRQSQLFESLVKAEDDQDEECGADHVIDPYEFRDESTMIEQPKETFQKGRGSKGTRRSTVAKNIGADDQSASGADNRKPSRKRASMAAPKKPSMLDDEQDEDSSYDACLEPARDISTSLLQDKASRRRSMML
ncbi:hypothetical protein KVR01_009645 [Diaporthe batatas]|uniref:uncharacterized protein n=1 Tax=Diaporthe batatas TaxID=748121 RepID=UPI001D047694|nr:uncharacterized protein KVR01_009645 [Diaporthe batatas]KAG8160109.1 hypothetical protein KVR01_009645 [Diaporthe batatas]